MSNYSERLKTELSLRGVPNKVREQPKQSQEMVSKRGIASLPLAMTISQMSNYLYRSLQISLL